MKLLLVLLLDGLILTLTGGGLGIYIHMYSYIIDEFVDPQRFLFHIIYGIQNDHLTAWLQLNILNVQTLKLFIAKS